MIKTDIEATSKINAIKELRDHLTNLYGNGATLLGCKNLIEEVDKLQKEEKARNLLDKIKATYVAGPHDHAMLLNGSEVKTLQRLLATEMNRTFGVEPKPPLGKLRAPLSDDWVRNEDAILDDPRRESDDKMYDDSINH